MIIDSDIYDSDYNDYDPYEPHYKSVPGRRYGVDVDRSYITNTKELPLRGIARPAWVSPKNYYPSASKQHEPENILRMERTSSGR